MEVCRLVHGGVQRGAWRCAEGCRGVHEGVKRGAEGCTEVHGGVCRRVCGGAQRWLPLTTIDLVDDNREFEV